MPDERLLFVDHVLNVLAKSRRGPNAEYISIIDQTLANATLPPLSIDNMPEEFLDLTGQAIARARESHPAGELVLILKTGDTSSRPVQAARNNTAASSLVHQSPNASPRGSPQIA